MGTGILWMQWCVIDWFPGSLTFSGIIPIDITVADGGNGPPEHIVIFRLIDRLNGIGCGHADQGHKTCRVDHRHVLADGYLTHPCIVGYRPRCQPKARCICLLGGTGFAEFLTQVPNLFVITCPYLALEIGGWT